MDSLRAASLGIKKVKKPIDKQHRMCYNKDTKEREENKNKWLLLLSA